MSENLKMKDKLLFTSGEFGFHSQAKNVNVTTLIWVPLLWNSQAEAQEYLRVTINNSFQ